MTDDAHDHDAFDDEGEEMAPADSLPHTPVRNAVVAIHIALLAVAGIAILMIGAGMYRLLQIEPLFFARTGQGASIVPVKIIAVLTVIGGLSLFVRQAIPDAVAGPSRPRHVIAMIGWLALLTVPAVAAFVAYPALASKVPVAAALDVNAMLFSAVPGAPLAATIGVVALVALSVTGLTAVATAPRPAGSARSVPGATANTSRRRAAPPLPRALRRQPLPVRLVARLFRLLDWIATRLIGFALLGAAYLIGTAIREERAVEPAALTWEQDPVHALIFYGAFGLVLAVPVLLPRSILVPTNLFKGLLKAVLITAGAVAAMPALAPLARFIPPDTLSPEVLALVPQAPLGLQAMAGFSILFALVAGLAGQFGRKRRFDYAGNPIIELDADELRQLRASRMGANA